MTIYGPEMAPDEREAALLCPLLGLAGAGAPQAGGIWRRRAPRSKALGGRSQIPAGAGRPRPRAAGFRIASSVVLRPRRPKIHGEPQARSGASPGSPQPLGKPSMTPTPGCHIIAHLQVPPQGPAWTCSGSWLSEQERRRRVFFSDLRRLGMRTRPGWRRRRQKEWASSSAPRRLPQPRAGGPQRGSRQTAASGLPGAVTQRPSVI